MARPPANGVHPDPQGLANEQPWQPYEAASTEIPLPLFRSTPNTYYQWRWLALSPFHRQITGRLPFVGRLTIGEVLLFLAVLGIGAGWAAAGWNGFHTDGGSTGGTAVAAFILTYALAMRFNVCTILLGLSHERGISWHSFVAVATIVLCVYHGLSSSEFGGLTGLTGWIATGCMGVLFATSALPQLRRRFFGLWQFIHVTAVLGAAVVATIHNATSVIALIVWGVDLACRMLYSAGLKNPHEVEIVALPGDVVRVSWSAEGFRYAGGQYVFINIPSVHWAAFHPFSLSSSPGSGLVHVHVRVLGDWTRALHALAMKDAEPGQPKKVRAFIEGPFGSPSIDLYGPTYKAFALVCGGIGVTPVQAFFNHLMGQRARGRPVRVARLVWSVRDKALMTGLSSLGFDAKYASAVLPNELPLSFQPDLISPNTYNTTPASTPSAAAASAAAGVSGVELTVVPPRDHIRTEFYLTQARNSADFRAANIKPELQPALRMGRLDVSSVLSDVGHRAAAAGETRVAVFVCGPAEMVREVEDVAARLSADGACSGHGRAGNDSVEAPASSGEQFAPGVRFDVHAEIFSF